MMVESKGSDECSVKGTIEIIGKLLFINIL